MYNRKDWWMQKYFYKFINKKSKHIQSGFSMSTTSSFGSIENKYDVYGGKDCMKEFCKFFREHAMKITAWNTELTHPLGGQGRHVWFDK